MRKKANYMLVFRSFITTMAQERRFFIELVSINVGWREREKKVGPVYTY